MGTAFGGIRLLDGTAVTASFTTISGGGTEPHLPEDDFGLAWATFREPRLTAAMHKPAKQLDQLHDRRRKQPQEEDQKNEGYSG
jgi:hypothetical protein